jgi:hypothetical protein
MERGWVVSGDGGLRATLEAAAADGYKLKDLTVLSTANDPFRVDTKSGRIDGEWFAKLLEVKFPDGRKIHLRGFHYAILGEPKPDGTPYTNTHSDWAWLCRGAGKAARWLGYVPFDRIVDERNSAPVVRVFEGRPNPHSWINIGEVELQVPSDLEPRIELFDYQDVQPFKLVLFGEKSSLEPVLGPIASSHEADLYLPTGDASDTMLYQLAKVGSEDGRPMVVFYFSDCDPDGWNMAVGVARKLQAFKVLEFPELTFQLCAVALTPDQVREHHLPVTPLKPNERTEDRDRKWRDATGVEQTEIDALATLKPDVLEDIALKAIAPFYDFKLWHRVRQARDEWMEHAQKTLTDQLGVDWLERLRRETEAKVKELEGEVEMLNDRLHFDAIRVELPDPPEIPESEVDGSNAKAQPLIDSDWDFVEATRRLILHKNYGREEKKASAQCKECGETFIPPRSDAIYCKKACMRLASRKRREAAT